MLSKIKNAILLRKRVRLSYFFNSLMVRILIFITINTATSVYVNIFPAIKIKQPVGRLLDFGFSISPCYGFIYSTILIVGVGVLMILDIQRLRDMGYRYPGVISIVLILLALFSEVLSIMVRINLISFLIDAGLLMFYILMLFSASKSAIERRTTHVA